MLFPIISTFLIAIGSWFLCCCTVRKRLFSRSRSTLELASGYSNTSFIGFPLISALYGEGLLSIAIICDQTMFLALSTLGIIAALRAEIHPEPSVLNLYLNVYLLFHHF